MLLFYKVYNEHFIILITLLYKYRLPWWLNGKESICQCKRYRFDPWVRKIPWRKKWQPTPVFLPGKSHGQRSLDGSMGSWGPRGPLEDHGVKKSVRHNLMTKTTTKIYMYTHLHIYIYISVLYIELLLLLLSHFSRVRLCATT